jgi:hypothetical protein
MSQWTVLATFQIIFGSHVYDVEIQQDRQSYRVMQHWRGASAQVEIAYGRVASQPYATLIGVNLC